MKTIKQCQRWLREERDICNMSKEYFQSFWHYLKIADEQSEVRVEAPVKPACEKCKYWLQQSELGDQRFGSCNCANTDSWVRGDSFEPPKYFSCVNFESKSV